MNKKEIKYTDEPIGEIEFINDFLPSPEQLVLKEETVKVTLALTKDSVDFFKKIAKEQESHYQTMIRSLLEQYTERFDTEKKDLKRTERMAKSGTFVKKDGKVAAKKSSFKNPSSHSRLAK